LAKSEKGMFIIKWKKGLESLNVIETSSDSQNESKIAESKSELPKVVVTRALKKQGYGKYQTYANFLDGEEKEQY
jgi:hypothetical protein